VWVKALKEFHDDAIYAGDLHRADMALRCGFEPYALEIEVIIDGYGQSQKSSHPNFVNPG
jgi:hypothetical protein